MRLNNNKILNIMSALVCILLNMSSYVCGIDETDKNTEIDYPIIDCAIEFNKQPLKEVMEKIANQIGIKYLLEEGVDENRLITFSLWGEYWMPFVFYRILHGKPFYWNYEEGVYYITTKTEGHLIQVEPINQIGLILKNKNVVKIQNKINEINYSAKDEPDGHSIEYIGIKEDEILITGSVGTVNRFRCLIEYIDEDEKIVNQSLEEIANGLLEKAKKLKEDGKSFRAWCGMAMIIARKLDKEEIISRSKDLIGEKEIEILHDYELKDYLENTGSDRKLCE